MKDAITKPFTAMENEHDDESCISVCNEGARWRRWFKVEGGTTHRLTRWWKEETRVRKEGTMEV